MRHADFEKTAPASPTLLITQLVCSLAGAKQDVYIVPNTRVFRVYDKARVTEQFNCNYGLNEAYQTDVTRGDLSITGRDAEGNARIVELVSHPFFVATLFPPQLSSTSDDPHPLIIGFVKAAMSFQTQRSISES